MLALVFLIIARGDAEGDAAASEPAANEAQNDAENPSESTFILVDVCHSCVVTVLTSDSDGVVWPVANSVRASADGLCDDDVLSNRLTRHWLLHHWYTWLSWLHHHHR